MDDKKVSHDGQAPDLTVDPEKGDTVLTTTGLPTVTKEGLTVHPQPTADPLDPLNWSWTKKHTILAIVMFKYFMFTYITTTTVPSFAELQESFGISYAQVNWTVAIPALGLALGPLIWSSLADIYGRRTIFLIGSIISLASTIGAARAKDYGGYMAARFFQGFGVAPASTVGMAVVLDLFFDYERGQKLGLWVLAIDAGLLVGPIIGGFIDLVSPEWIQWLTAIMFAVLLVIELFLMPETLYPRNHMLARMPASRDTAEVAETKEVVRSSSVAEIDLKRTKKLLFINFRPVPGMRHPKPWASLVRFVLTFKFPAIGLVLIYSFAWYWWVLSVITMLPAAYVEYSPQIQGLLFIGLLVGTLVAELFFSGRLSDYIVKLARRKGTVLPETRLWLAYPAAVLSAIGLIVFGISVDKGYHWIVGQIAMALLGAGIQMGNTITASYVVDCYPLQSMAFITFYAVWLNLSAFIDPFFIAPWQASSGWTWCFAVQGILTVFVGIPAFAAFHIVGPKLRKMAGEPSWVNPEYDNL